MNEIEMAQRIVDIVTHELGEAMRIGAQQPTDVPDVDRQGFDRWLSAVSAHHLATAGRLHEAGAWRELATRLGLAPGQAEVVGTEADAELVITAARDRLRETQARLREPLPALDYANPPTVTAYTRAVVENAGLHRFCGIVDGIVREP